MVHFSSRTENNVAESVYIYRMKVHSHKQLFSKFLKKYFKNLNIDILLSLTIKIDTFKKLSEI